jgi:uncharacterized alpha-E superfamily protein
LLSLLSRYADEAFWLGRHVERAENMARLLDVTGAFGRDQEAAAGDSAAIWRQALDVQADLERFQEEGRTLTPEEVIRFYTLDGENPGSIRACIASARQNALQLRPLLSVEVWEQLNGLYQDLTARAQRALAPGELSAFCSEIKLGCQTHAGIIEGTLYRDEAWYVLQIGRMLERADMTARLIDLRAPQIAPKGTVSRAPLDISQWTGLLRSAAGLHGYRRVHGAVVTPDRVAGYLIFDRHHARSIRTAIETVDGLLRELIRGYQLPWEDGIAAPLHELCIDLREGNVTTVIADGMRAFLDRIQQQVIATSDGLRDAFFATS